MLDSHRLAPHPELTLDSLGRWWGRRGDRQGWKHTGQDREGLANLGTKAAWQAQGEGGGAGSSQPPADPSCPLGRAQTSKWSLPNLF